MQARLGHQRPRTTARYPPLTPPTLDVVHAPITALMAALDALGSPRMLAVADVLRRDGREARDRFAPDRLPSHRRAIAARLACRTAGWGGLLWPCAPCGQAHSVDHSGRHRRCPTCHRLDPGAGNSSRAPLVTSS
jgi:Transposase zinc-binding domain